MTSNRGIRWDAIGWVGLALTLVAVVLVQWGHWWGYLVAAPALVLMLAGIVGMQKDIKEWSQ